MARSVQFTCFIFLCVIIFQSAGYARSGSAPEGRACSAPNLRTDVRPDVDGPATKVTVRMFLIDLMEISDIQQTMTGDIAVLLTWVDPRLSQLEGCEIRLEDIWSPGLAFLNSGRKILELPKEVSIGPGGEVSYGQRYYGVFATYHNLQEFPFDKQVFRISLLSLEWLENDVQLVVHEKNAGRRAELNISDWIIERVEATIGREHSELYNAYVSRYDFNISAQRITGYYLWKIILPLCLIVAMSWTVFWINPAQHGPQIGLSATSMLTLIAFIFATTTMLPVLGYLTHFDRFIVGSTALVFAALIESLVTINLVSKDRLDLAMRIDYTSRFVFPLTFILIIALSFMI